MIDPHEPGSWMECRLERVRQAARDNEFVDIAEAERMHRRLRVALQGGRT